MNEHDQRIAIAEWMGWRKVTNPAYESDELWHIKGKGFALYADMPNYTRDLNAMHSAEQKLAGNAVHLCSFVEHLRLKCCADADEPPNTDALTFWDMLHASAAQRSEALLRTLNLWRDDPATPQPTAPSGAQPGAVDAAPTKGT